MESRTDELILDEIIVQIGQDRVDELNQMHAFAYEKCTTKYGIDLNYHGINFASMKKILIREILLYGLVGHEAAHLLESWD